MNKIYIFTADWCVHCKAFHRVIEKSKFRDHVSFEDAEESPLASKFNIRNLPLVIVADEDDNEIARIGECYLNDFDDFCAKYTEF